MGSSNKKGGLSTLTHPAALGQHSPATLHTLGAYGKTKSTGTKKRKSSTSAKRTPGTRTKSAAKSKSAKGSGSKKSGSKFANLKKGTSAAKSAMAALRAMRGKKKG